MPVVPSLKVPVHTGALTQREAKSPLYLVAWEQVSSRGNVCYEEPRVGICSLRAVNPKLVKKAGAL